MFDMFAHALFLMVANVTSQQQDGQREGAHAPVNEKFRRWKFRLAVTAVTVPSARTMASPRLR